MTWAFDIIRAGYQGDTRALRDLMSLSRTSLKDAAAACFVSPETFRRWLSDRPAPPIAARLLAILTGYMPWRGWQDWRIDYDGELMLPGRHHARGVSATDILMLPTWKSLALRAAASSGLEVGNLPSGTAAAAGTGKASTSSAGSQEGARGRRAAAESSGASQAGRTRVRRGSGSRRRHRQSWRRGVSQAAATPRASVAAVPHSTEEDLP